MEISTLIVDDSQHAINSLKIHLESFPLIKIIGERNNGKDAMNFLREQKPDLLFLDIEMDDIDGLELAKHIQSLYTNIMIIFVTGHTGFALKGYEYHPIDFLTKPIDFFRLEKAIDLVKKRVSNQKDLHLPDERIGMKVAGGIRIVAIRDIIYIEKRGRKVSIVCENEGTFQSSDPMKILEEIFVQYGFYRCHQSFIIPIHQIKSILHDSYTRSHTILLKNNTELPLSRNKYHELTDILKIKGISMY